MYFAPAHFLAISQLVSTFRILLRNSAKETFFVALDTSDLLPGYHLSLGEEDEK